MPPKDTFSNFESQYEATNFDPQVLARALTASAKHYSVISGEEADESELVTDALAGLNRLESSTTYPLLLALFESRARGTINSEQLAHAIGMLRGFILRRFRWVRRRSQILRLAQASAEQMDTICCND